MSPYAHSILSHSWLMSFSFSTSDVMGVKRKDNFGVSMSQRGLSISWFQFETFLACE